MYSSFGPYPFLIHPYGLIVASAVFVGFLFVYFRAPSFKIKKEDILDLPLILLIPVLFGARAYHVLDYWDFYTKNPAQIVAFWQGGLGIWGALIVGLVSVIFYAKVKQIKLLSLLDLLAPSLILAQAIGRLGNFFNLEAFGPPTTLPWKIYIPPSNRPFQYRQNDFFHPTFFYEMALDFLIFFFLIFSARKFKDTSGLTFFTYVMLYSLARFSVEFLRIDTWSVRGIKIAQILAVVAIVSSIYFFIWKFYLSRVEHAKRKLVLFFKQFGW